ncbi:GntR family transcriptional regulator, partial [Streptomyces solisilvae]
LIQLRRKIDWMYLVDTVPGAAEQWAERGAVVDAVARGDGDRARALMALHAERSAAAHRLRFTSGDRPDGVRNAQRPVNTPVLRH